MQSQLRHRIWKESAGNLEGDSDPLVTASPENLVTGTFLRRRLDYFSGGRFTTLIDGISSPSS